MNNNNHNNNSNNSNNNDASLSSASVSHHPNALNRYPFSIPSISAKLDQPHHGDGSDALSSLWKVCVEEAVMENNDKNQGCMLSLPLVFFYTQSILSELLRDNPSTL